MSTNDGARGSVQMADIWLGRELRQLRKARGLSLAALGEKAGLSVGLISQIERGLTSPSVRSLRALSHALSVPVSWFFQPDVPQPEEEWGRIVRPQNRRVLNQQQEGIIKELLTPDLLGSLEILLINIDPGGAADYHSHKGEEAGLVLAGTLELWLEERRFLLNEGDSFRFKSTQPHRYGNPGDSLTKVLWALNPPYY